MTGTLRIIGAFVAAALITVGIVMIWPMPVHAQTGVCTTIEDDRAIVEANPALEYLGVEATPFTDAQSVFYLSKRTGITLMSRVVNGCVETDVIPMGRFVRTPDGAPVPAPVPTFRRQQLYDQGIMRSDYLELRSLY